MLAPAALAQSGADVVRHKGCLNCHDLDKKKVGPSLEGKTHSKVAATDAELKAAIDYVMAAR